MSWLDRVLGRKKKAPECAICGVPIVEGLRKQVYNWVVNPVDDLGRFYGGFCSKCGKHYCWQCAYRHGEMLLKEQDRPVVPTREAFDSVAILDHDGMMYCPRCGDLRMPRTLQAL